MDDDDHGCCAVCGTNQAVNWSPVFAGWYCPGCQWNKTEEHLRGPVTALPVEQPPAWLGPVP